MKQSNFDLSAIYESTMQGQHALMQEIKRRHKEKLPPMTSKERQEFLFNNKNNPNHLVVAYTTRSIINQRLDSPAKEILPTYEIFRLTFPLRDPKAYSLILNLLLPKIIAHYLPLGISVNVDPSPRGVHLDDTTGLVESDLLIISWDMHLSLSDPLDNVLFGPIKHILNCEVAYNVNSHVPSILVNLLQHDQKI